MESSQLKRISVIMIGALCLSPIEFFSNKLSNKEERTEIMAYADIKLEKNYLLDNYEIFNPNIKTASEDIEKLASENKKRENSDSENKLESETTIEQKEESDKKEEVVATEVEKTSTQTTKQVATTTTKKEAEVKQPTVKPTPSAPASPNTNVATNLVDFAKKFVGYPYKAGGTDLYNGVDCSGFTMKVFEQFGYSLPHSSKSQATLGSYVPLDNLEKGDLIFYGYNGSISHVAIYIGNGQIVHATTNTGGIKIANYQMMPIITARRILK